MNWYKTWTVSYYAGPVTESCSDNSITTATPDFSNDIACRITLNAVVVVQSKILLQDPYDSDINNMTIDLKAKAFYLLTNLIMAYLRIAVVMKV